MLRRRASPRRPSRVRVELPYLVEHQTRVALNGLLEHGRERRPAVFDVQIDVTGLNGAVADEGAAEIEPAIDGESGVSLDGLRHQLAENDLLREILGSHDDPLGARPCRQVMLTRQARAIVVDAARDSPRCPPRHESCAHEKKAAVDQNAAPRPGGSSR